MDSSLNKYTGFYIDANSKKVVSQSLFGIGLGLGFIQKITDKFSFSVEYKRNVIAKNLDHIRNLFALNVGLIWDM